MVTLSLVRISCGGTSKAPVLRLDKIPVSSQRSTAPEVDAAVGVNTWHHQHQARALGAARPEPAQPEHHRPLVLLHNLAGESVSQGAADSRGSTDREAEPDGEGEGDHQEEVGDEHQQVHQPTLLTTASSRYNRRLHLEVNLDLAALAVVRGPVGGGEVLVRPGARSLHRHHAAAGRDLDVDLDTPIMYIIDSPALVMLSRHVCTAPPR